MGMTSYWSRIIKVDVIGIKVYSIVKLHLPIPEVV